MNNREDAAPCVKRERAMEQWRRDRLEQRRSRRQARKDGSGAGVRFRGTARRRIIHSYTLDCGTSVEYHATKGQRIYDMGKM